MIEELSRDLRKITKEHSKLLVESERYKTLAQFLEEENERLRNLHVPPPPDIVIPPPPEEKIVYVPVERIVEIPVDRVAI